MNVLTSDGGVWWIANSDEIRSPAGLPILDLVKVLADRFRFALVPTQLPTGNEGLLFREGVLERQDEKIVIQQCTIYNNGAHIITPGSTERADQVLETLIQIVLELGVRQPITAPLHFYVSEIVCDFEHDLDDAISGFDVISQVLESSSAFPIKFRAHGLTFNVDPLTLPPLIAKINPTVFRIERRAEIEYEKNRYYSFANLTTPAHLTVLETIEKSLSRRRHA